MKRILVLLTVALVMAAMMAMGASSAMAKNLKIGQGEPLISGNAQNTVLHCGPFFELLSGVEGGHGAVPLGNNGQGGHCVIAPK